MAPSPSSVVPAASTSRGELVDVGLVTSDALGWTSVLEGYIFVDLTLAYEGPEATGTGTLCIPVLLSLTSETFLSLLYGRLSPFLFAPCLEFWKKTAV